MKVLMEMSDEGEKELKNVATTTGFSFLELINYALTILMWCLKEIKAGKIIASIDENTGEQKQLGLELFRKISGKKSSTQEKSKLFLVYSRDEKPPTSE